VSRRKFRRKGLKKARKSKLTEKFLRRALHASKRRLKNLLFLSSFYLFQRLHSSHSFLFLSLSHTQTHTTHTHTFIRFFSPIHSVSLFLTFIHTRTHTHAYTHTQISLSLSHHLKPCCQKFESNLILCFVFLAESFFLPFLFDTDVLLLTHQKENHMAWHDQSPSL